MIKVIYVLVGFAVVLGLVQLFMGQKASEVAMCPADVMMCSDGTSVGRTGASCEFVCPEVVGLAADIEAHISEMADLITVASPAPEEVIASPLAISGEARGYWYFEASFPIVLTNWDGLVIAEGFATADGDWMTEDFVPYTASIDFVNPYTVGDPDFMKNGTLILKKDNPSGMPENDDALEIPISFAP